MAYQQFTRTTPSTALAVDRAKIKRHLKIEHTAEDDDIDDMIQAAQRIVENYLWETLMQTTWTLAQNCFEREMELLHGTVSSVTSVKYIDADGTEQEVSSANYDLITLSVPAMVRLKDNVTFPLTDVRPDAIRIIYVAGETDNSNIGPEIVSAIKLIVGDLEANRTDEPSAEVLSKAYDILHPIRKFQF